MPNDNIKHSSASIEWYTPPNYIELAREVLGEIDLDPASNDIAQQWIKANNYCTQHSILDGLSYLWWVHKTIWLNPPYGNGITNKWITKLISEYEDAKNNHYGGLSAICLVRPAISASWYNALAERFMRCETYKRIKFIDAEGVEQGNPAHGNVFFLLTEDNDIKEKFAAVFSNVGIVSKPYFSDGDG